MTPPRPPLGGEGELVGMNGGCSKFIKNGLFGKNT
jgi:hypothetical protein